VKLACMRLIHLCVADFGGKAIESSSGISKPVAMN
jgi:hypothetical protein